MVITFSFRSVRGKQGKQNPIGPARKQYWLIDRDTLFIIKSIKCGES